MSDTTTETTTEATEPTPEATEPTTEEPTWQTEIHSLRLQMLKEFQEVHSTVLDHELKLLELTQRLADNPAQTVTQDMQQVLPSLEEEADRVETLVVPAPEQTTPKKGWSLLFG